MAPLGIQVRAEGYFGASNFGAAISVPVHLIQRLAEIAHMAGLFTLLTDRRIGLPTVKNHKITSTGDALRKRPMPPFRRQLPGEGPGGLTGDPESSSLDHATRLRSSRRENSMFSSVSPPNLSVKRSSA